MNKSLFDCGLLKYLTLKKDAIPSIMKVSKTCSPEFPVSLITLDVKPPLPLPPKPLPPLPLPPKPHRTRTVGTQLSEGTLKLHHSRSKSVQTVVKTSDRFTQTEMSWLQFSSSQVKLSTSGNGPTPRKRRRLEFQEEDDDDVNMSDSMEAPGESQTTDPKPVQDYEDDKFIVFERSLRELFQTCPVCRSSCDIQKRVFGTFVSFTQSCRYCMYRRQWDSGPVRGDEPVGNLQLSAAAYFTGGSFLQLEKICKVMKLNIHNFASFKQHSGLFLEPALYNKWINDQKVFLEEMKTKNRRAVGGDMRALLSESGCYTLMDLDTEKIVDLQLVQSQKLGGSFEMEKDGLERSLDILQQNNIEVDFIVTDRHNQVKNYLQQRRITQYYDVWHMEKDLSKELDKLSKEKDCEVIKRWLPAMKNHIYWVASSSKSGAEMLAKWTSFINHVQDIHTHGDPVFPKCVHEEKVSKNPNKWLHPDSTAFCKIENLLVNKRVLADVQRLSSSHQTSAFEAFHSVVKHFAPKDAGYSFDETLCRLYLASFHFNENVHHIMAAFKEPAALRVSHRKRKRRQSTIKPVKTKATFGYVDDLMHFVFNVLGRDCEPLDSEPFSGAVAGSGPCAYEDLVYLKNSSDPNPTPAEEDSVNN